MRNNKQSDMFRAVNENHRQKIIGKALVKILKNGETLFCQGDSARYVYMVAEGHMQLSATNEWGDNMIVRYIVPGELMALISVFEASEYPVAAKAVGDCKIFQWENKVFMECLHESPEFAVNVIEALLFHLKYFQERFFALSSLRAEQRIAKSLIRFMERTGRKTEDGILIGFPLSRQDIADYTGSNMCTASRILSDWEKRGWIASGREKIIIKDIHALELLAEKNYP